MAEAILAGHVGHDVRISHGRGETGMATYRLGFYGFGDLTVSMDTGQARIGLDATAWTPMPGESFVLAGPSPVLTPLQVEETGSGARVAVGSGLEAEGQEVNLDFRLTVMTDEPVPRELTLDVLRVGSSRIGLLCREALCPGVTYRIAHATAGDTLVALHHHGGGNIMDAVAWDPVFCFTFGTLVDTPDGPRLIEDLRPGDLVTTLGNGSQPLRWTGSRHVPVAEMLQVPDLQPVEFATGVIGNARPLRVSPQHRILLNDWRAQVFFGEDEVLIPAKAMVNGGTIRQILPAGGVTYIHLLFDRHEILVSEGALSESFHPGETGLMALDEAQRRELDLLFPGLDLLRRRAVFPIVKLSEARALRLPD